MTLNALLNPPCFTREGESDSLSKVTNTVEPRYNEPLYNKVLGIAPDYLYPSKSKITCMEKNLNVRNIIFCQFLPLHNIEVPLYLFSKIVFNYVDLHKGLTFDSEPKFFCVTF